MENDPPRNTPALQIDAAFLNCFRAEVLAYCKGYYRDVEPDTIPPPPTAAIVAWFMGIDGEEDASVHVRVQQTFWWFDTACTVMGKHPGKVNCSADIFRYAFARFGRERDPAEATRTLIILCLALESLFKCAACWDRFQGTAPRWTVKKAG